MYKTKEQKHLYQKEWFEKHPYYFKEWLEKHPYYMRDRQRKKRGSTRINHKPGEIGYIGASYKRPNKFSTIEERNKNWSNLLKERRKTNPYNSQLIAYERIEKEIPELERRGFRCFPITEIIPDIIALKDGKIYAIEVEYAKSRKKRKVFKYESSKYKYDSVMWILRKK